MTRILHFTLAGLSLLGASLLAACAAQDHADAAATAAAPAVEVAALVVPPREPSYSAHESAAAVGPSPAGAAGPLGLDAAVQRAGDRLFNDALAALGESPRELVIDPLIDAHTGQQTTATLAVGAMLARLAAERHPQWKVKALSRKSLADAPLLLIGTLTPVSSSEAPRSYAAPWN